MLEFLFLESDGKLDGAIGWLLDSGGKLVMVDG